MISAVRKFSVKYGGDLCEVLFVIYDEKSGDVSYGVFNRTPRAAGGEDQIVILKKDQISGVRVDRDS